MIWLKQYLRRSEDAAFSVIDGEAIIVASSTSKLFALNRVATVIWEQADGSMTGEEIVKGLCKNFNADLDEVTRDADEFVRSLLERGLLVAPDGPRSARENS